MSHSQARNHGLSPGGIDLWYTSVAEVDDPALLDQYRKLITATEAQQADRFVFDKHRHQYLVTRALVRSALSYYYDVPPQEWVFAADKFGKPHVAGPRELPLAFNISHSEGLVICGVADLPLLGVDVERIDRRTEPQSIARRFFAQPEVAYLERFDPSQQREAFFRIWTLKEAYIKARGKGFSLPLADFAFQFAPPHPPTITFLADLEDDPRWWQFVQLERGPHYLALAARCPQPAALALRVCQTVPLQQPAVPQPVALAPHTDIVPL